MDIAGCSRTGTMRTSPWPSRSARGGSRPRSLSRIYGFCRTTDDLGDESGGEGRARLERWHAEVAATWSPGNGCRSIRHPVRSASDDRRAPPRCSPVPRSDRSQLARPRRYCPTRPGTRSKPLLPLSRRPRSDGWSWEFSGYRVRPPSASRMTCASAFSSPTSYKTWRAIAPSAEPISWPPPIFAQELGMRGRRRDGCADRAQELLDSGRALERLAPPGLRIQLTLYRMGGNAICDADCKKPAYRHRTRAGRRSSKRAQTRLVARATAQTIRGERHARRAEPA